MESSDFEDTLVIEWRRTIVRKEKEIVLKGDTRRCLMCSVNEEFERKCLNLGLLN